MKPPTQACSTPKQANCPTYFQLPGEPRRQDELTANSTHAGKQLLCGDAQLCAAPALPRAPAPDRARRLGKACHGPRPPSPGAGYAARPLPTRTAVKGRTGPHLLLPAPRSAESKRTSPRPPHTGDTPATDTHPSPPGSQAEEERRRSASSSAPGPFPYPGAPGPPSAATAISPRPRHDAARPPPPYPLPHAEDTHPPHRRREGASRRRRHLRRRGDRACAARPPTFPGWRGAAVRVNRRSPAAGGAGRE